MSHLEKLDAVVHDSIESAKEPTLAAPIIRILADIKKLFGSLVFLLAGTLVLTACGGSSTSTTTTGTAATYSNPSLLVSGAALNVNATNQVIIDARSATDYAAGHITNAINIPLTALNATSYTLDKTTAVNALSAAGVSNTAKIVVYGADVDGNAGWMFWALEYLGSTDVHMLDGGYTKWIADSRTTATAATTLPAATFTPTVNATKLATKADVLAHYADANNYAIIDSRNYNDATNNNFVTSHIPNAVSILIGDFLNADKTVKSYTDIKALLDANGVISGKTVITHCYVGWRSAQEYFVLRLMGFPVSNYDGSWTEWAADTTPLPTQTSLLASAAALNVNATNQVIIDTRSAADYAAGHITNAINLLPSALDTSATSHDLNTASAVAAVLGAAGVSNTATIIVYGKGDPAVDFGGPERVFWALEYLGVGKVVSVLDGGYTKWVADGRTVVTTATTLPATTFTAPAVVAARLATKADVVAHYADPTYAIADSRFNADYVTAHIPNAINILETDFLNADKTTKSKADIKTMLDAKGVTAGKKVIAHCYVGYMSAQGYFMFRMMGFNVSNYDGSWTEWAADTTLPTNTGPNP